VLIAETGGQNVMIVDSTAPPEQVTDAVVASAFRSCGQRCSALRVLLLQEEIADSMLEMIAGAMRELRIGDPADPRTDVGPVIDAEQLALLTAQRDWLRADGKRIHECELPPGLAEQGNFFKYARPNGEFACVDGIDHGVQASFAPTADLAPYRGV
jgi:RHH-type proline utilization regulon transcriptional repressor/proline dehydrogenase/delta 1-pyrroline-5-carboxylate dehydrogenase